MCRARYNRKIVGKNKKTHEEKNDKSASVTLKMPRMGLMKLSMSPITLMENRKHFLHGVAWKLGNYNGL